MANKGLFYVGLMLLLLGLLFLVVNVGSWLLGSAEIDVSIGRLWPLLILWLSLAFFLPIIIWWDERRRLYGLAMPGTILLVNGLLFLYTSVTENWRAWLWLWPLEPFAAALGLLALYLLGRRAGELLLAALIVGGVSIVLFAVTVSALGGQTGAIIGGILLVVIGLVLLFRALVPRRR